MKHITHMTIIFRVEIMWFEQEHIEDGDEDKREEFEYTQVQVFHKINAIIDLTQSLGCGNKLSTLFHMGCFWETSRDRE